MTYEVTAVIEGTVRALQLFLGFQLDMRKRSVRLCVGSRGKKCEVKACDNALNLALRELSCVSIYPDLTAGCARMTKSQVL
jgi:hypothetical protein